LNTNSYTKYQIYQKSLHQSAVVILAPNATLLASEVMFSLNKNGQGNPRLQKQKELWTCGSLSCQQWTNKISSKMSAPKKISKLTNNFYVERSRLFESHSTKICFDLNDSWHLYLECLGCVRFLMRKLVWYNRFLTLVWFNGFVTFLFRYLGSVSFIARRLVWFNRFLTSLA